MLRNERTGLTIALAGAIVCGCFVTATQALTLSLSDPAYGYISGAIESGGGFVYNNVQGSGINVTLSVTGSTDVNDFSASPNLGIGNNTGASNGLFHVYTFTFSHSVNLSLLEILNINMGNDPGFAWNDRLNFSGSPTFTNALNGVTFAGATVFAPPGSADNQSIDVAYTGITSFSFMHGLGGAGNANPGFLLLAPLQFTVPEPATFALLGLGLAGLGFSRRKQ